MKYYITTTLPYVNSEPHIGFAVEIIRADIMARHHKFLGFDIFFNTGTDEHGLKIYQKAIDNKQTPKEFVDFSSEKFKSLKNVLGLSEDINFIRTTDENHIKAAMEFWKVCDKNGYIYKKDYQTKYCVGCELEKTDSELVDGKCPDHPNQDIQVIKEENYFFRFSSFQKPLLDFYKKNQNFVIPESRFLEIKNFVSNGLQDFSISRLKSKMPWGIEVPGDSNQVMYVWFDALVNYISAIGWPEDMKKFEKWQIETGGMVQYCGKDNLRQQSAMWQAMLMAAGLPNSKTIVIDGFVTGAGGIKMSKSLGNVINPIELVNEYGTEALRYYIAREVHPFEDTPFTKEGFKESYNANLANGLGNLISRIMKMAEDNLSEPVQIPQLSLPEDFLNYLERYEIQKATDLIWQKIAETDKYIQETQPFKMIKIDKEKALIIIKELVISLGTIGGMLNSIMPETSKRIRETINNNKKPISPFFLRKE